MTFVKTVKREIEVALSKHAQPVWFRILKYLVLGISLYFFWESRRFWIILSLLFVFAMFLHFWYRYKTRGWSKSYGLWDYDKNKPGPENE